MEQKIKIIIILLAVILAGSLFFNVLIMGAKQQVARERDSLKEENTVLLKKAEDGVKTNQRLQERLNSLTQELSKRSSEMEALQSKYEVVDKEREKIAQQLKELKDKTSAPAFEKSVTTAGAGAPDAYWAGILQTKKGLEEKLSNLQNELKKFQINNEELERGKANLGLEINNLNREKQDLARQLEFVQKQVEYNKKTLDVASLELVGEKNDKLRIEDTFKAIKNENAVLRRQLKSLSSRKITLEKKLLEFQEKNSTLEQKLTEADKALQNKATQLEKLGRDLSAVQAKEAQAMAGQERKESVELSPIIVRPREDLSVEQTPDGGRVLSVNKENGFVIVDLGEESGIRVGDILHAYDNEDKEIGSIEVVQTRRTVSACNIQRESAPILEGCTVR